MRAQLLYYFKISLGELDAMEEEEIFKLHADLNYVRQKEKEQQESS